MPERGIRIMLASRRLDATLRQALPDALLRAVFGVYRRKPVALAHGMTLELGDVVWAIKRDGKTFASGDELLTLMATAYATTEGVVAAIALAQLFGVTFDTRTSHRLVRVIETWAKTGRSGAQKTGDEGSGPATSATDEAPSLSPEPPDLFLSLDTMAAPAPAGSGGCA